MLSRLPFSLALAASLWSLVACEASDNEFTVGDQIVGGELSPSSEDYVVFLENTCTGTLIAPNLVLTAAHCVLSKVHASCWNDDTKPTNAVARVPNANEFKPFADVLLGADAKHQKLTGNADAISRISVREILTPSLQFSSALGFDLCERDLALLVLSKDAVFKNGRNAPTATLRYLSVEQNTSNAATLFDIQSLWMVGYGVQQTSEGRFSVGDALLDQRTRARGTFYSMVPNFPSESDRSFFPGMGVDAVGRTDLVSMPVLGLSGDSGAPVLLQSSSGTFSVVAVHSRSLIPENRYAAPWQELIERINPRVFLGSNGAIRGGVSTLLAPHKEWIEEGLRRAAAF